MAEPAIIELEVGWNDEIKRRALDPLERLLNSGLVATKLFDSKEYIEVYTVCYNMCTQRTPYNWSEALYQRHGETISNYLRQHSLPALLSKHDVYLLIELVKRWSDFKVMNTWMKKFFMYLVSALVIMNIIIRII